tara:strand:- start:604 stop:813 length:210 start_codon:yes stop_codon:yes gene_type:complete
MKIRDKKIKEWVHVAFPTCADHYCYWPRKDPGVFTPGQGYRTRGGEAEYICGHNAIHGCPDHICQEQRP